jgi:hypothetical protein
MNDQADSARMDLKHLRGEKSFRFRFVLPSAFDTYQISIIASPEPIELIIIRADKESSSSIDRLSLFLLICRPAIRSAGAQRHLSACRLRRSIIVTCRRIAIRPTNDFHPTSRTPPLPTIIGTR